MLAFGVFAVFCLIIVLGWSAICRETLLEEIARRVVRWENEWNHPEDRPWPGYPGTIRGPRFSWLCSLADWVTHGACHD